MPALDNLAMSADAARSSLAPLLSKSVLLIRLVALLTLARDDTAFDFADGLSLLSVRPQQMLTALHQLVILLGLRLSASAELLPDASAAHHDAMSLAGVQTAELDNPLEMINTITAQLLVNHETIDKVRGMEAKLDYQIKKLIGLADAAERAPLLVEEAEEGEQSRSYTHRSSRLPPDMLAFRPNPSALLSAKPTSSKTRTISRKAEDGEGEDEASGVYRPPRVAAVPYNEAAGSRRKERRAPALLSEFASTLDGAPMLEASSGLSIRPAQDGRYSNSLSAKRAAELKRMNEFEEENMMRLVTTKREAKRRREDEAALALGYGVGGSGRGSGRRQNGLEAELDGVLGGRGSNSVWRGVGTQLGQRENLLDRARKSGPIAPQKKRPKFERDVNRRK